MSAPDPKPAARVKDPALLRRLHQEWTECALAMLGGCLPYRSLHHISKHPRDDVRGNLVMLCGSGTTGHHGRYEHGDKETRVELGRYFFLERPDVIDYLTERKGDEGAADFLLRRYSAADAHG